ncbi:glutathione S-transferase, partial [Bradyrhizobium sp. F1.2.2]
SPNSRRVRIYLAEKGISMPLVPVDLGAKEQFSEAYRAINSRAVVPALVPPDGTAIGEVPAILSYLEGAYPEPPLLGTTPKQRALVTMWERRMEQEGFASVMEAVRNGLAGLKSRAIAGAPRVRADPSSDRAQQASDRQLLRRSERAACPSSVRGRRPIHGRGHNGFGRRRFRYRGDRDAHPERPCFHQALVRRGLLAAERRGIA